MDVSPVAAQVLYEDGFRGSNSIEIMNDLEPYEMVRALILMMIVLLES